MQAAAQHDGEIGEHEHAQQHRVRRDAVGDAVLDEHQQQRCCARDQPHHEKARAEAEHLGAHVLGQ